jgi:hypothetical protein
MASGPENIKDSIRKSPRKYATYVWLFAQKQISQRVFERPLDGGMNLSSEFQSQAYFSALIPEGSVKDVPFGFRADNEPEAHWVRRERMRASTSVHELPASGSFS